MAKETPEVVESYKKKKKAADKIIDTMHLHHAKAHTYAIEKVLIDEEGNVDFGKLEKPENQEAFANAMAEVYVDKAKAYFKVNKELNDLEKELLLTAYMGVTKSELMEQVATHGKRFNFEVYNKVKENAMKRIRGRLYTAAGSHIKDKHIDEIIKYTKTEELLDPEAMTGLDAATALSTYEEHGALGEEYKDALREAKKEYILKEFKEKHKRHKKAA